MAFVGISFLLCVLLVLIHFRFRFAGGEQKVAGEMTLTENWVEITPARPLVPSRQYQSIVLDVAEPLVRDNSYGRARRADGTEFRPEVVLVSERGDAVPVELSRTPTPSRYENSISGGQPPRGVYVKVRVRCDRPLRLRGIVWSCWDGK